MAQRVVVVSPVAARLAKQVEDGRRGGGWKMGGGRRRRRVKDGMRGGGWKMGEGPQ